MSGFLSETYYGSPIILSLILSRNKVGGAELHDFIAGNYTLTRYHSRTIIIIFFVYNDNATCTPFTMFRDHGWPSLDFHSLLLYFMNLTPCA